MSTQLLSPETIEKLAAENIVVGPVINGFRTISLFRTDPARTFSSQTPEVPEFLDSKESLQFVGLQPWAADKIWLYYSQQPPRGERWEDLDFYASRYIYDTAVEAIWNGMDVRQVMDTIGWTAEAQCAASNLARKDHAFHLAIDPPPHLNLDAMLVDPRRVVGWSLRLFSRRFDSLRNLEKARNPNVFLDRLFLNHVASP